MLATDLRHDLVRTVLEPLEGTDAAWAEARYAEMEREIAAILPPASARPSCTARPICAISARSTR